MGATMMSATVGATTVEEVDSRVDGLSQGLTEARSNISTLQDQVSKLQTTDNTAAVKQNTSDIAANKTAIGKNTTDIAANKTSIEKNASDIAANKTAIGKNTTDIANNKTSIEKNAANITANKTAIETAVANQNQINENQNKINGTLTQAVQQNSKAIVSVKDMAQKGLDKANAAINTNAGNIAQNKADIAANTKAIETNASDIKANKAEVDTKLADIKDTMSKANAFASADATDAANKAAAAANKVATEESAKIDGIKSDISNIFKNETVNDGKDGKYIQGSATIGQNVSALDKAVYNAVTNQQTINGTLTTAIQSNSKLITDTNGRVDKANRAINTNAGNIAQNKHDIAENQKAINTNASEIKANKEEMDTKFANQNQINENQNKINGTLTTAVQNNSKAIVSVKDMAQKGLDKANAAINTNAGNIAQNKHDIDENKRAINKNASDIKANSEAIGTKAAELKDAINTEATTRDAADANLQNQITTYTNAFATNIATNNGNYVKADNTVGQNLNALDAQVGQNSSNINQLFSDYSSMKTDINKVGARSAALAGLHAVDYDPANKLSFSVASGSFKGENSMALGAFYRPNENIMFSAASTMGDSDNAYTFGLSFKIGPSSAKTKTTSPDAEELYKVVGELQDQLAAQQKEIEQLKADKAK